jgi:hypothetical protein
MTSRTALGPSQPSIQWVPGALSLGVKRPGREADHSPPSSNEVKECVELYLHSSSTPSWHGAQLSTVTTSPVPYLHYVQWVYEDVSKSFRTGRLDRELQMVELSATRYSCIAVLWVSLVSVTAITLGFSSQRVFIAVIVYFVIDSVRRLLDTSSYVHASPCQSGHCAAGYSNGSSHTWASHQVSAFYIWYVGLCMGWPYLFVHPLSVRWGLLVVVWTFISPVFAPSNCLEPSSSPFVHVGKLQCKLWRACPLENGEFLFSSSFYTLCSDGTRISTVDG